MTRPGPAVRADRARSSRILFPRVTPLRLATRPDAIHIDDRVEFPAEGRWRQTKPEHSCDGDLPFREWPESLLTRDRPAGLMIHANNQ
jgi:hypothetical protein